MPEAGSPRQGACATEALGTLEGRSEEAAGGGEGPGDDCTDKSLWSFLALQLVEPPPFSPTGCLLGHCPPTSKLKRGVICWPVAPSGPQGLPLSAPWVEGESLGRVASVHPCSPGPVSFQPASSSALCSSPPPHAMMVLPGDKTHLLLQGQRQSGALRASTCPIRLARAQIRGCRGGDPRTAAAPSRTPPRRQPSCQHACRPWPFQALARLLRPGTRCP